MATDDALQAAILASHVRWSATPDERFPVSPGWEPLSSDLGTENHSLNPGVDGSVPSVPTVPNQIRDSRHRTTSPDEAEALVTWLERAAIHEYDGGMSRAEAEARTALELGPRPGAPAGDHG